MRWGAIATGITVLVVLVAKFTEGAWITLVLIPGLMLLMRMVKKTLRSGCQGDQYLDTPVNAEG